MIVYNVKRRWFTLKADAESYRRAEGLPPPATAKVTVSDRDDLAALLNALCGTPGPAPEAAPSSTEVAERNKVTVEDVPDYIPRFLLKDHGLA